MTDKQRRSLSNNELIHVCRYLDKHKDTLKGMPPETLVAAVKNGTGVAMTKSNLRGIRAIDGYDWLIPERKVRRALSGDSERLLSQALLDIYAKLGENPPEALAALAEE